MSNYIKGFDGLRGLAALTVVFTHLNGWAYLNKAGLIPISLIPAIDGSAGVQIFFALSGYLITSLLIKEFSETNTISFQNFFIRRTLRIFPLYYLLCLFALCVYLIDPQTSNKKSLLFAFLYLYNFIPAADYTPYLGHAWSLAVEEHFYIVWPLFFLTLFPLRRSLIIYLGLLIVITTPIVHFFFEKQTIFPGYFIGRWTFIAGSNILAGCVLAIVISEKKLLLSADHWRFTLPLIAAAFYLFPVFMHGISWSFDNIFSVAFRCFGIVFLLAWIVQRQQSLAVNWLEFSPLKYIGKISYGVYIYQGMFLATGPNRQLGHFWPPEQSTGLLALIIIAPVSFHFFEKPILSLKYRLQRDPTK